MAPHRVDVEAATEIGQPGQIVVADRRGVTARRQRIASVVRASVSTATACSTARATAVSGGPSGDADQPVPAQHHHRTVTERVGHLRSASSRW